MSRFHSPYGKSGADEIPPSTSLDEKILTGLGIASQILALFRTDRTSDSSQHQFISSPETTSIWSSVGHEIESLPNSLHGKRHFVTQGVLDDIFSIHNIGILFLQSDL
jgi:hypothetical protein